MTRAATTFSAATGMTHTTLALPPSMHTACSTKKQVCSSGHLTWNPQLVYGNFSVRAQWFNSADGIGNSVDTSTGFIGLDANDNVASITMGFHGQSRALTTARRSIMKSALERTLMGCTHLTRTGSGRTAHPHQCPLDLDVCKLASVYADVRSILMTPSHSKAQDGWVGTARDHIGTSMGSTPT